LLAGQAVLAGEAATITDLKPNTWVKAAVDWKVALPADLKDAGWSTSDGYSDSVWRSKTGTVIIRTGINSKSGGYSPGFYTNTSAEWDPRKDTARVLDIANWTGGSYGGGALLPTYKDHPTPTPRHTYDGICYVPEEDSMYLMLGANWRIGSNATEEAKAELQKDGGRTWKYSFETKRWTCIEDNVWKLFKCSPYENHMTHWPEGNKLIFLNDGGNQYAEFDLKAQKWAKAELKNKCPMSLYNARSTWDSKRSLWVLRLGPNLCAFSPATREFTALPKCWDITAPDKNDKDAKPDPRLGSKGVCYISKHDAYLITGPTGDDTMVYHAADGKWESVKGGGIALPNGYCQYSPELDLVLMSIQLDCFKLRYAPAKPAAGGQADEKARKEEGKQ
jgi:hypothetical protein